MNLIEAIQSENMDEVIDSMNAYAESMLKSVKVKDFNGKLPVDFVGDLLLKVIDGTRDWNKASCSFKEFLFGCLKSDISNFFKTQKLYTPNEVSVTSVNGNPINIVQKKNQLVELLKQEGADDDELFIFECWMEGIYKPIEIAEESGVPVKNIYTIIKRLERKIKKIELHAINIII